MWSGNSVFQLLIVQGGGVNTGLFVYNGVPGKGNLVAQIVAPGTTHDPFGNAVSAVLNIGTWNAGGSLLQHFGADPNGNLYLADVSGHTRIFISTGVGGGWAQPEPAIVFYNSFGAVILVVDPSRGGVFQYQDNNSAVQGALIGAQVGKTAADPIDGTTVNAGVNLIDPAFGDSIAIVGANIGFNQVGFTATARVSSNTGSGSLNPFIQVDAPEQGHSGHFQERLYGTSPDGTVPGGVVFGEVATGGSLSRVSNTVAEIQGSLTLTGISTPASPPNGNVLMYSDTNGLLRVNIGIPGDANNCWAAWSRTAASATPQTISSSSATTITGCTFTIGSGLYMFRARVAFHGASASGTANFSVTNSGGTANSWNSALFTAQSGTAGAGFQNAALGPVDSQTLETTSMLAEIEGELTSNGTGTLALACATSVGGANVIIDKAHFWLFPLT